MRKIYVVFIVLLWIGWQLTGQAAAQESQRIIVGSNVRVRSEPTVASVEISRLNLGTIVQEVEKTAQPESIGQMQDYWYHVVLPDGQPGWVFGSFTMPFDVNTRAETYRHIVRERLQRENLNFTDLVDFSQFLTRAATEFSDPEMIAELKLARLVALGRSVQRQINGPEFDAWIQEQQGDIFYNELQGGWLVYANRFWQLYTEYQTLPIADDIAWAAANNPLGGECEGYLPCHLNALNQTYGRYLVLYPNGKFAENALEVIREMLQFFVDTPVSEGMYDRNGYVMLQNEFKKLRNTVTNSSHPKNNLVLEQLDQIATLHLRRK